MQHEPRALGERAGDADELAPAVRELGRQAVGDVGQAAQLERPVDVVARMAGRSASSRSRSACSTPMRWLATSRFSSTVRSSNSSTRLERAHQTAARAQVRAQRGDVLARRSVTVPAAGAW